MGVEAARQRRRRGRGSRCAAAASSWQRQGDSALRLDPARSAVRHLADHADEEAGHERAHARLATQLAVAQDDPLWYKDAIIYQLHIKSFFDSNNDGIGDFPGLISKLDYIAELGVNTLWLLPFYPSPRRDDGYDIADYTRRPSRLRHARPTPSASSTRPIAAACASSPSWSSTTRRTSMPGSSAPAWRQPGSPSATSMSGRTPTRSTAGTRIIFVDTERSNWTWDPVANAYYWHRFYAHQPDLNFDNPRGAGGGAGRHALLARPAASTACGSTPCPTWSSARAPTTRTCPRRTRC